MRGHLRMEAYHCNPSRVSGILSLALERSPNHLFACTSVGQFSAEPIRIEGISITHSQCCRVEWQYSNYSKQLKLYFYFSSWTLKFWHFSPLMIPSAFIIAQYRSRGLFPAQATPLNKRTCIHCMKILLILNMYLK